MLIALVYCVIINGMLCEYDTKKIWKLMGGVVSEDEITHVWLPLYIRRKCSNARLDWHYLNAAEVVGVDPDEIRAVLARVSPAPEWLRADMGIPARMPIKVLDQDS